jgi:hypothetical protein
MSEKELAKRVINWLQDQHWEVYQEVQFSRSSGIADIVAVRAGLLWVIECKTSLTFTVLDQAWRWSAHLRSIAVPAQARDSGSRSMAYRIAEKYLRIGIIEVGDRTNEICSPPIMREHHRYAKRMIGELCEEHKTRLAAGSNGGGYYTPYRRTMDSVMRIIGRNPGCTLKQIMADLKAHHYASDAVARSCIRTALSEWERNWCEVKIDGKEYRYYIKEGARL